MWQGKHRPDHPVVEGKRGGISFPGEWYEMCELKMAGLHEVGDDRECDLMPIELRRKKDRDKDTSVGDSFIRIYGFRKIAVNFY